MCSLPGAGECAVHRARSNFEILLSSSPKNAVRVDTCIAEWIVDTGRMEEKFEFVVRMCRAAFVALCAAVTGTCV